MICNNGVTDYTVCFITNECPHSTVIDNDDYFQDTIKVTVPPGETVTRVTVTTRKNIFLEGDEFFEAILSTSDECDNVVVQINTAYITILDTSENVEY